MGCRQPLQRSFIDMTKAPGPKAPAKASAQPAGVRARLEMGQSLSKQETARYIADFTLELSSIAKEAELDLLAYLLDMTRLEAVKMAEGKSK